MTDRSRGSARHSEIRGLGPSRRRTSAERRALDAYVKLHRAVSAIQARTNSFCGRHGLTVSQFATLEVLYHKGPLCQRDVASKILRSGGNLTLVVDNLEKNGLVERRVSETDRREKVLHLTDDGRDLIERIFPEHAKGIRSIMAALTSEEQTELARLCRKLGRGVQAQGRPA
jgi:MarR family 2-MHQ and catechol resistance regulon transcriptional repressor